MPKVGEVHFFDINMARILNLELSNKCNSLCEWCGRNCMTRKIGELDIELAKKVIKKVKDRQDDIYLQLYGDPLIYPHLFEVIKICEENNIEPGFFTNGKVLNDEMIEKLSKCKMRNICVTVNQFAPLNQIKKLIEKCNFKIRPVFLNVPKKMKCKISKVEYIKWCWKNKILPEIAEYDYPLFRKKMTCCFQDNDGNCFMRKINAVSMMYDGQLITCIKDYDGKTAFGKLNDLDNFKYDNIKCPYLCNAEN